MKELYDLLKTPDGLKKVSELITAIENEIKEKRRSRIDEEGEEDDEGGDPASHDSDGLLGKSGASAQIQEKDKERGADRRRAQALR